MAENTTQINAPSVKKYVDYANQQVDEQAILDKYNAATQAQFNIQREQNRQAENQFYNQMYNTQKTAMDTIRQSNAAAVSSGASRGVQAANELSAILGLQSESVAQATELAQANRQTAQEETAAVLENVLNAYQQAAQERSNLVSQGIEAASVDAQEAANEIAATEAQSNRMNVEQTRLDALSKAAQTDFATYMAVVAGQNRNYSGEYSLEGANSLNLALSSLTAKGEGETNDGQYFTGSDFVDSGDNAGAKNKLDSLKQQLETIQSTYGLDLSQDTTYNNYMKALEQVVNTKSQWTDSGWGQFVNFLTMGMAGQIEALSTGASLEAEDLPGLLGAFGEILAPGKDRSKGALTKDAQSIYTALTAYIKTKYNAKGNTTTK